jgi:predicted nuclease of predicted toxin-antitoxin system
MKILLDNNLSPRLADALVAHGWDAIHVGALGLAAATDEVVLQTARTGQRVLVSADTDFGALLARSRANAPSVVLVRRVAGRRVEALATLLIANLPPVENDLHAGSVVALTENTIRIHRLPLG